MSHLRKLFIAALYISWLLFTNFLATPAKGQDPVYWQLTDEDGLPSMTIYELTQDDKGLIWMGTSNGLVRYDGQVFDFFEHPKQKDNEIVTVRKDNYGRIWYSDLSNQLYFIKNDSVYTFYNEEFSSGFNLSSYLLFQDHLVLKSLSPLEHSDSTLVKIFPLWDDFTQLETDSSTSFYFPGVQSACVNRNGSKYLYTYSLDFHNQSGLHSEHKTIMPTAFDPLIKELKKTIYMPYNNSAGSILEYKGDLIAKFNNTFCYASKGSIGVKLFSTPNAINQQYIIEDELWLLTKKGLRIYDLKESIELKEVYFNEFNLTNLLIDKEGNYWFGTDKKGILIVPSIHVKKLQKGTENHTVHFISSETESKTLNIGQADGVFKQIDFSSSSPVEKTYQLPERFGKINKYLNRGQHYFATDIGLVYKKTLNDKTPENILKSASVKNFIIDQKGNFWLADSHSVFKIENSKFLKNPSFRLFESQRVLHQRSYALLEAFDGTIWIGSTGGLYYWKQDTLYPFLQDDDPITYSITDIIQTPDSTIWIATNSEGVITIKNGIIANRYNVSNVLPTNRCNKLFSDNGRNIWVATSGGLVSINTKSGSSRKFDINDGLPANDVLCMTVLDSTIWAGTSKGLVSFPLNINNHNQVAPPIYITNFSIHEKDTSISDYYKLKHNQNSLQIDFLGLNYRSRGNITYQYQMIGIDSSWTTTKTRYARFPGLSPGNYTFNVISINEDGVKSQTAASVKLTIAPPWWRTWWFLSLTGVFLLGTGWIITYLRFRNIRKQDEMVRKINELSLKALQTQMNPHFIFNSLNAIQQFFTTNNQEQAMNYLAKFARLIRIVFEQSKKSLISLEEEIAFLKVYLSLEDLRFNKTIDISFNLSEEVKNNIDFYQLPPLLIQPIIENAFKHGLFHKKEDKKLIIQFEQYERFLKCTIIDNGVGREYTKKLADWRVKNHNSTGLKATEERLSLLHRDHQELKHNNAFFKITDLYNNDNPAGTKVELII